MAVQGGERYLYPDVVVTCGRELFEDAEHDILLNPLVIIEVLSPSTEVYDRGEKFLAYQTGLSDFYRRRRLTSSKMPLLKLRRNLPKGAAPKFRRTVACSLTII